MRPLISSACSRTFTLSTAVCKQASLDFLVNITQLDNRRKPKAIVFRILVLTNGEFTTEGSYLGRPIQEYCQAMETLL